MRKHIHMTIDAARREWKIFGLPKEEVLAALDSMEAEGKKLVQSEDCDNFDEEKGCLGHKNRVSKRKIDLVKEGIILPAKQGTCPECATAHAPEDPHNQQSLHYQYTFRQKHDRWPTWHDAMAHCSDVVKSIWLAELRKEGVEV